MDSTNQDKPSSVKLDGFAPASGSGAASSFMTGPTAAAASASASASAAGGISSASTSTSTTPSASSAGSIGTSTKKPPSASANAVATKTKQRTNAKKKLNKNNNGGGATASSSAASSSETTTNNKNNNNNNDNDTEEATILRPLSEVDSSFTPLSLPQIQLRLRSLLEKLPRDLPAVLPPYDSSAEAIDVRHAPVKSFASALQIVVEEYNLLLSLVSCATYRWGVDRSGASQQNLSVMSAELQQCQEVISNVVSARLSNVLCPAVDVVVGEVEVVRTGKGGGDGDDNNNNNSGNGNNGEIATKKRKLNEDRLSTSGGGNGGDGANNERRINHYARPLVDPSYVHLCHRILARNAPLIRHTVATSLYTAQRVIGDYLKAMKKDSSHDSSKGGYY